MGVFKKLKEVLFDVEEELPVITKEEIEPKVEENPIKEIKIPKEEIEKPVQKKETNFNFPIDDFEDEIPPKREKKDYSFADEFDYRDVRRSSKFEEPIRKKDDYDYDRRNYKEAPKENKPFKPSPVISPVYGILDQNYTKDDVIVKTDVGIKNNDLDEALKKAYGIKKQIKNDIDEEFEEPLKTLDDILTTKEEKVSAIKKTKTRVTEEVSEIVPIKVPKEEATEEIPEEKANLEATLETDLFNLIDSIYESRNNEEEEE